MFDIESLQEILDQLLSRTSGSYSETLWLILKLLGICAGPVLLIALGLFVVFWLPQRLAVQFTKEEQISMFYNVNVQVTKKGHYSIACNETEEYKKLSKKRLRVYLGLFIGSALLFFVLLSPLFFLKVGICAEAIIFLFVGIFYPLACILHTCYVLDEETSFEEEELHIISEYDYKSQIYDYLDDIGNLSKIPDLEERLKTRFCSLPIEISVKKKS